MLAAATGRRCAAGATSLELKDAEASAIAQAARVEDGQPAYTCAAASRMRVPMHKSHRPPLHHAGLDKVAERGRSRFNGWAFAHTWRR